MAVNMNNNSLNVGVIVPPDRHYKPILYSDAKASADFNVINRDIYKGIKRSESLKNRKTPLSIKILAGVGAVCAGIFSISKLIKR